MPMIGAILKAGSEAFSSWNNARGKIKAKKLDITLKELDVKSELKMEDLKSKNSLKSKQLEGDYALDKIGMRANLESITDDVLIHAACIPMYILPVDVMFGTTYMESIFEAMSKAPDWWILLVAAIYGIRVLCARSLLDRVVALVTKFKLPKPS